MLNESIRNKNISSFFKQHGGVDRNVVQHSLGDLSNAQVGFIKEFPSRNDALNYRKQLMSSDRQGLRSDADMKYHFEVYTAKDGAAILVGINRDKADIVPTWGGDKLKKVGDRINRNGWNRKTRSTNYADDSDTYYYSGKAKDAGIRTNQDFRNKMQDRNSLRLGENELRSLVKRLVMEELEDLGYSDDFDYDAYFGADEDVGWDDDFSPSDNDLYGGYA